MSEPLPEPAKPGRGQSLVYEAEDGRIKIDMRLDEETLWLSQAQLAELFQSSQQNVSLHIRSIYEEGELAPEATHKKYLLVRAEGGREVKRLLDDNNLDMIISVGYRVKSHVATRFRIWATQRLNDRDILTHAGKISHEMAQQRAEAEYTQYHQRQIAEQARVASDFDLLAKQLMDANRGKKKP